MPEELQELNLVLKAIFVMIGKTPNAYNRKDIWEILCGRKKGSRHTYKFKISRSRLSGILDLLEFSKTLCRNDKGLYSIGKKENLSMFGIEV